MEELIYLWKIEDSQLLFTGAEDLDSTSSPSSSMASSSSSSSTRLFSAFLTSTVSMTSLSLGSEKSCLPFAGASSQTRFFFPFFEDSSSDFAGFGFRLSNIPPDFPLGLTFFLSPGFWSLLTSNAEFFSLSRLSLLVPLDCRCRSK